MKAVIQIVSSASCVVEGNITGSIGQGLMILLGVGADDTERDAELLAQKIALLRIFNDENDKMNLSCIDIGGEVLVISNFTLYADYKKGRRPTYFNAAQPEKADGLYEYFCLQLNKCGIANVQKGIFGADMTLNPICTGPVTIVLESEVLR